MGSAITCCFNHSNSADEQQNGFYMLPKNPRDLSSEWICEADCTHVVNESYIKNIIMDMENDIKIAEKVNISYMDICVTNVTQSY